jgi:hypothetical protein
MWRAALYFVSGTSSAFTVSLLAVIQHIITVAPSTTMSLRHSHQLKYVTVRVLEINASATIPIIELAVTETPGSAAV